MNNEKLKAWLFLMGLAFMVAYTFLKHPIQDSLLLKKGKSIKGVIISNRGYNGKGGFISKEENGDAIIYKYSFNINGKDYKGDSQSTKFLVGDSIDVLYLESFPSINRPAYYLEDDK